MFRIICFDPCRINLGPGLFDLLFAASASEPFHYFILCSDLGFDVGNECFDPITLQACQNLSGFNPVALFYQDFDDPLLLAESQVHITDIDSSINFQGLRAIGLVTALVPTYSVEPGTRNQEQNDESDNFFLHLRTMSILLIGILFYSISFIHTGVYQRHFPAAAK